MDSKKKRPESRAGDRRTAQHGAGPNSRKTRPDVPSTRANKAATGKLVERGGSRR
jgi:hypothetical protein